MDDSWCRPAVQWLDSAKVFSVSQGGKSRSVNSYEVLVKLFNFHYLTSTIPFQRAISLKVLDSYLVTNDERR